MNKLGPLKLTPSFREKVWGSTDLSPLFGKVADPIGEVWYTFEENTVAEGPWKGGSISGLLGEFGKRLMGSRYEPSTLKRRSADGGPADSNHGDEPYFPLLTKLLFPSQKLSVQVHPDDAYALRHEHGPGKTEMWYVVAAAPDARIGLGLTEDLSAVELADVANNGEIEKYLRWVPVSAGQTVLLSPGTLHTLGPGVVICEVQQNSDLTYRFYDWGRSGDDGAPRPLHITQAAAVTNVRSRPSPADGTLTSDNGLRVEHLASCDYFFAERISWESTINYEPDPERAHIVIVVEGAGSLADAPCKAGDAFLIPAESDTFALDGNAAAIRAFVP